MSDLIHFRAAIEYFSWPLGDRVTQGHIRTLNEAYNALQAKDKEIERLRADVEDMARVANAHGFKSGELEARIAELQDEAAKKAALFQAYEARIAQLEANEQEAMAKTHETRTHLKYALERIAELEGALLEIQNWPMNRDAVKALGLCQYRARQALGERDECEHEWLHHRAPLTNKPDKCVLCGIPKEQALGERE